MSYIQQYAFIGELVNTGIDRESLCIIFVQHGDDEGEALLTSTSNPAPSLPPSPKDHLLVPDLTSPHLLVLPKTQARIRPPKPKTITQCKVDNLLLRHFRYVVEGKLILLLLLLFLLSILWPSF